MIIISKRREQRDKAGVEEGRHTVPVGDVLVGDAGGYVKHDDTTLAVDIVSITKTAKLLLASRVPHVKLNLTEVLRSS